MATPVLDRGTILQAIRGWPPDARHLLVQAILEQMGPPLIEDPVVPPDSRGLAGLLANGKTPPTDDEVAQWLDEHRMEK